MEGIVNYIELSKKFLDKYNIILLGTVGSRLSGFHTENSDTDYMGVFVEPIQDVAGFATSDTAIFRTAEVREGRKDAPSQQGDIDITLFGLRKFLKLCLAGNPTALSLLYNPFSYIERIIEHGKELKKLQIFILSKNVGRAFNGFIQSNMAKASKFRTPRYYQDDSALANTKQALILSWLLYDIIHGSAINNHGDSYREKIIRNIIEGGHSFSEVESIVRDNVGRMNISLENLQDTPNYNHVEAWMLQAYKSIWNNEVQETSQQYRFTANQAGSIEGPGEGNGPQVEGNAPF